MMCMSASPEPRPQPYGSNELDYEYVDSNGGALPRGTKGAIRRLRALPNMDSILYGNTGGNSVGQTSGDPTAGGAPGEAGF